jgi:tellurite resistance protein TerC
MTSVPGWAWAAAGLAICCLLSIDLLASRRGSGVSRAVLVSAAWVGAGTAFGLVVALWQGGDAGQEYFAAYLIEKALSVDNLFIFAVLFRAFAVPAASQHRVLFFGVIGALVLRGGFITVGAALIHQLSWAFYIFGAVLLVAAIRMARGGPPAGPGGGFVLRGLRKIMPVAEDYDGMRFLTRRAGKLAATPLLVALVAIETMDVIFAIDSIPAAFGVTTDVFIVFTSNAFAILGLRALYFVLEGAMERFTYLSQGLAVLLAFIGAKMIFSPVLYLPTVVSLGCVIVIIASAVLLSVWKRRRPAPASGSGSGPVGGSAPVHRSAPGDGSAPDNDLGAALPVGQHSRPALPQPM